MSENVSCPSFTSSVEEGRAVCPGEELTYTCTIFDDTSEKYQQTEWSGLNCSLHIIHGLMEPRMCGPFSVNATGSDGDCHTSTLTVNVSPELNGTVIQCLNQRIDTIVGSATLFLQGCINMCIVINTDH